MSEFSQQALTLSTCGLQDIAASDWNALLPGRAEDYAFFSACTDAVPDGFNFSVRVVKTPGNRIAGVCPAFDVFYPVPIGHIVLPASIAGAGSPLSDVCPIGLAPDLDSAQRIAVLKALLVPNGATASRRGVKFQIVKDVAAADHRWMQTTACKLGFACVPTLPRASLSLDFKSSDDYLRSLKKSSRKYLKAAMERSGHVSVERIAEPGSIAGELYRLYAGQQERAAVDSGIFDALSPAFFSSIARHKPDNTLILVYRIAGEIAGFSISIYNDQELLGKYVGLRQPLAREHRLYFLNWMEVVKFCLTNGIKTLRAGQNSYKTKAMLGCTLERNWLYYRHPNAFANALVKPTGRYIRFDTMDAELKSLEAEGAAVYAS